MTSSGRLDSMGVARNHAKAKLLSTRHGTRVVAVMLLLGSLGCQQLHFLGLHLIEEHERHKRMSKEELAREKQKERLSRQGIHGVLPFYAVRFAEHEDGIVGLLEFRAEHPPEPAQAPETNRGSDIRWMAMEHLEMTLSCFEEALVERDEFKERIEDFRAYLHALCEENDGYAAPEIHRRKAAEVRQRFGAFIEWIESLTVDDLRLGSGRP